MNSLRILEFPDKGIWTGGDATRDKYVPNPSSFAFEWQKLSSGAKRSTNGYLTKNTIAKKRVMDCSWDRLSRYQKGLLEAAISDEKIRVKVLNDKVDLETGELLEQYMVIDETYSQDGLRWELSYVESDDMYYYKFSLNLIEY